MKKIILSKVHRSPSPEGMHHEAEQQPGSSSQETAKPPFQPPLPIGPPPPDSPTRIQIKKEKLDDGYQDNSDNNVQIPIFDVKCKQEVVPVDPRRMCRRFVRGTCTRGSACIFKHEIDLSQLRSIYKFCWDFQNKVCTRPACKHVHATIFEEQHFYRTGYLPPSALAHQKKENFTQNKESSSTNVQEAKNHPMHAGKQQTSSPIYEDEASKLKRLWDEYNVGGGRSDIVASGPLEKKCKNCDKKEYSLELATNKMNETLRSLVRVKEETGEVTMKSKRLFNAIQSIVTLNSLLSNKLDINRSPIVDDQMFPGKEAEGLFAELLKVAEHNNGLSSDSPSH